MTNKGNQILETSILIADDDADDRLLVQEALIDAKFPNTNITFVEDGNDLMDYLNKRGQYLGNNDRILPTLILLDLNMPKKDGKQALQEIKTDPNLRQIPVVILTTSGGSDDIKSSYDLGANTYISKPANFDDLVKIMQTVKHYWLDIACLT
ncbi:MAG: response regulator [Methylococcaceae bacterium]|jgi:CheY-like chemotaxis protein